MSLTTAQKIRMLNNASRPNQESQVGTMLYNAASGGYPGGGYQGRIYFVNNVSGSATNDGLTWGTAFAQISTAVTAWEAYRITAANVDPSVRGIIYVQGTATAYTALTALPNYCDLIGIGADPRGNGSGIARVTAATGVDTVGSTGVRGLHVENMQFTGSGTGWAMNIVEAFRSEFINCAFVNKSTGALQITKGGGLVIRNCQMGGDTVTPAIGFSNDGTANFNQCLVEDNCIYGSTTGFAVAGGLCDGTVVRNNTIYGGTTGILDTSAGATPAAWAWYVGNYVSAGSDAINCSNGGTQRVIGNWVINNATAAIERSVTDITS
jgi:hypothetical protein